MSTMRLDDPRVAELMENSKRHAERMRRIKADYLYDGVWMSYDGDQYWLHTETGADIALCTRTLGKVKEYIECTEKNLRFSYRGPNYRD